MTGRIFPDFQDSMEWNLVSRATYVAPTTPTPYLNRLPARSYVIENSHLTIVGCSSMGARSSWSTAGWASMILPFLPSSTTQYPAAVRHQRQWLRLGGMNLLVWPRILPTWFLQLDFPYWLPDVSVEIWRYDGRDIDAIDRIDLLEQNLN